MDISVVVPLYNEEESLPELFAWIERVMKAHDFSYEVIFVNDGSTDRSWQIIEQLQTKSDKVRGIKFRRNYGKSPALYCGFEQAQGDVVITMDADLQDSPDEIPELYRMITEDDYDLVSGWKQKRYDPLSKTIPTKLFNATARKVSGIKNLHDFNCGLKAYRKDVIKNIEVYGEMHRYIPYLANVNKDLFGISVCLLNGQTIHVGDTDYRFGIESVSKVHTAILALRQYGAKEILDKIGADATGLPFNSIIAILLENDHPSTPLVNAGAISACSMVQPIGDSAKKWDAIVGNVTDLCGSAPQLIDELYKSESDTNFNNRSIAWLLKNYNRIYDDPDMSLDLYTRQCSLGVTALQLSIAAGTIANGGVNPVTKKEVFDATLAPKITAMIAAVGFYEHTGDWMYTSGIPAKTGVGGGVMGVLPGQFGIAAFAPPLDGSGNSVKAQLAIQYIMNKLELNVFSNNHITVVD